VELTKKQQDKLAARLNEVLRLGKPCDLCGNTSWQLMDRVYELREYNQGNFVMGTPLVPLVIIGCSICGNTHFLNAITLGMVDPATGRIVDG
jgi:hypothetical protein